MMVEIERTAYKGWPNCVKISNRLVDLLVLADVGPRIYYFAFKDGENLFHENPADYGVMSGDEWHSYGGHRLWHAPEDPVRTYAPDNQPVQVKTLKDGARFTAAIEPNGIQKVVEVHLDETEARVKVRHTLINHNLWAVPLSVWALTVMRGGGKAIVPQPPRIGREVQLTPTHSMVLWGYTKMNDPRWTWGEKYFFLQQDSEFNYSQKIGMMNSEGWAAYQHKDIVFIKKFAFDPHAVYPDFNCNFETYTDQNMLEVETLAPMVQLEPGQKTEHVEEWSLHRKIKSVTNDEEADRYILPLLNQA